MSAEADAALDEIADLVESARSVPLSASCVVPRAELLELVEQARAMLPATVAQAEQVLGERDSLLQLAREQADLLVQRAHEQADLLVEQGREQGELLVEQGQEEQDRLVSTTAVFTRAQVDADRLVDEAEQRAITLRVQSERYADTKLESLELALTKTLGTVQRGRHRLRRAAEPSSVTEPEQFHDGDEDGDENDDVEEVAEGVDLPPLLDEPAVDLHRSHRRRSVR